jgi:hypothetical protein
MTKADTASVLFPPLTLRDGNTLVEIASLDEALLFAETHPLHEGDYEGMIRRLQSAHETADRIEASNAFKWWSESNAILVEARLPK